MISRKAIAILTLAVLFISTLNAQQSNIDSANKIIEERGQVSFIVEVDNDAELKELSKLVTIDHHRPEGNRFHVLADQKRFDAFLSMNKAFELPEELNRIIEQPMYDRSVSSQPYDWDSYPTYSEYLAMMDDFGTNYPAICQKVDLGNTVQGRELLAVKISDNVTSDESEPRFLYISSMHGDELCGYVLMLRLIDYMLTNYGTDPEITDLINNNEIWISPLHNPDGCYWGGNNTVSGAIRYNANGVDLNRNYPDPQDGMHTDGQSYQVETMAYMALAEQYHFVLAANHHGGAEVINYPWDTFQNLVADEDYWLHVCHEWADTVHYFGPANYMDGFDNGVTNGYDWYEVQGGRQDFMNYDHHCRELTTELSNQKTPSASSLPNYWDYNYRSMINYMKEVENGIRGHITDAITGDPIEATAYITSHDLLNTWVKSEMPFGDYYRPIKAGTYDVTYEAPCYQAQTITVSVADFSSTTIDVALVPLAEAPVVSDVIINSGETASLNASLSGTANWYSTPIDPNPIFTGNPFVTPALTNTTSYYVENEVEQSPENIPSPNNSSNGSYYTGNRFLIFDCFEPVTLNKVTVNAQNSGSMTVTLEDSEGNVLESASISLTGGIQEIDLDFSIPVGRDMALVKSSSSTALYRNNSNVSYPYELKTFINIKNSDAGSNYYYNFYNWEIQRASCISERVEVVVTVNTSGILGCTNSSACNYNSLATEDDGSCILPDGCTDSGACNYSSVAQCDNGSCEYLSCAGCTNSSACNYDSSATIEDGSCIMPDGCTDSSACNYSSVAQCDNGSCEYLSCAGCTNSSACNYDSSATIEDGSCILPDGCTDSGACNYSSVAQCDDGSCEYLSCAGCTNSSACNYDSSATIEDGSCVLPDGCTDSAACNYSSVAQCDDGSCEYSSCSGCIGDFNDDGEIDAIDLLTVLSDFGCTGICQADLNNDEIVNSADLLMFIAVYGEMCD